MEPPFVQRKQRTPKLGPPLPLGLPGLPRGFHDACDTEAVRCAVGYYVYISPRPLPIGAAMAVAVGTCARMPCGAAPRIGEAALCVFSCGLFARSADSRKELKHVEPETSESLESLLPIQGSQPDTCDWGLCTGCHPEKAGPFLAVPSGLARWRITWGCFPQNPCQHMYTVYIYI